VKSSFTPFSALVPFGVATLTLTVPRVPGGERTTISVSEADVKSAAGTSIVPKATFVAPVKAVPEIVTAVPPPAAPTLGLTEVTVGAVTRAVPDTVKLKGVWFVSLLVKERSKA
jgi:hypothetical protein